MSGLDLLIAYNVSARTGLFLNNLHAVFSIYLGCRPTHVTFLAGIVPWQSDPLLLCLHRGRERKRGDGAREREEERESEAVMSLICLGYSVIVTV